MPPNAPNRHRTGDESSLRRMAQLLRPYARQMTLALLMQIGLALVNMVNPMFIKLLLDDVFPNSNWSLLWVILLGIMAVYVARNALYFSSKFMMVAVGENVCFSLRKRLFEHLQQMNLQFYRRNKPGQISSRVMDDSFIVQGFIQDELPTVLQATLMFVFLVAVIYATNWQLALASTIILPLHLAAYFYYKRPIKQASRDAQEQISTVYGNLIEKFLGVEVVKGFTAENRETETFQQAIDISRKSQMRSKRYHISQKIVADLLVGLGTIGLLGFGAYQVMGPNQMKPGTFIAFFSYVMMLYPTVVDLMSGFAKLTKATASVDRVSEMLDSNVSEQLDRTPRPLRPIRGHLKFESVCFRYTENTPVLTDISFEVQPGQVCAIVGQSGTGKSTLVSLVPRFIEPDMGHIYLDGTDIRQIDLRQLRENIATAFQECFLFNSSILENLRYAKPDASMAYIIDVARKSGAHEFISKLPQGYQTVLGENGVDLSRGEKQRITLTRAMLKDPQILILDEATASIDLMNESLIIPAILKAMRKRTTLMITHRPELLRHADIVVQLAQGRVTYYGPPEKAIMDGMVDSSPTSTEETNRVQPRDSTGSGIWQALNAVVLGIALWTAAGMASFAGSTAWAQEQPAPAAAAESTPAAQPVAPGGSFVPLPGLKNNQLSDLLMVIRHQLNAQLGYVPAEPDVEVQRAPAMDQLSVLVRDLPEGQRTLTLGYKLFDTQPPHLWTSGQMQTDQGAVPNPDLPQVQALLTAAMASLEQQHLSITVGDLAARTIELSYIEADRCLAVLKTLGYNTVEYKKVGDSVGKSMIIDSTAPVDLKQLPIVAVLPSTDATNLVGGGATAAGAFGQTVTPSVAADLPNMTSAAPLMRLMVLYHPDHPEQFAKVLDRIRNTIDVPARQILIEAMVLEISEQGLKALGVDWTLSSPSKHVQALQIGTLPTLNARNNEFPTFNATFSDIFGELQVRIQALVREGKAEILSRPSVLTLDNRQASIRVGEDIPVATSAQGLTGGDKLSFDFRYIPTGILLNVRPRISADGEEVSMQIDGIVSAQVPGQDLVIRDTSLVGGGGELARAPRISTRRVQTYSRIANNTPFIIGGLISKDETEIQDKVPVLGDVPLLGNLFKSQRADALKREVIIVITPFVLPEDQIVGRNLPKDEDAFDSFGHKLFRDAYRIRAEDVFDLKFLSQNPQVIEARILTDQVARLNADLVRTYPFDRFIDNRFPGEHILVARQMYEVIKRRDIEDIIDVNRLIFFQPDEQKVDGAAFHVEFLRKYLGRMFNPPAAKEPDDLTPLFNAMKGKAVALTFTLRPHGAVQDVLQQPVPQVSVHDCPDERAWSSLLWRLNQRDEEGNQRWSIVIRSAGDLVRLKRAIVVKSTVELNASERALTLQNFSMGRLLLMPTIKPDKVYLIDQDTAKYFFYTEQYYPAVQQELQRDTDALRDRLQQLGIAAQNGPLQD